MGPEFLSLESLSYVASLAASAAVVLSPAVALAAGAPRAGPGRALVLGLTSKLLRSHPATDRAADALSLRAKVSTAAAYNYIVVSGPKGVGKTQLINAVLGNDFGVEHLDVAPATGHKDLVNDALRTVARTGYFTFDPAPSARRVLFFHKLFFGAPVTVVLHAAERKAGEAPAAVDSAARVLAGLGVRVVVDASTNSMAEEAVKTMREVFLNLEPVERSVLESMGDLSELLAGLETAGVADVVWSVLGGVPAAYLQLDWQWKEAGKTQAVLEAVATKYMRSRLGAAISDVDKSCVGCPDLVKLYAKFLDNTDESVEASVLRQLQLTRPSPDKVLRAVFVDDVMILIPADSAKRLVLKHNLRRTPSTLQELKALS